MVEISEFQLEICGSCGDFSDGHLWDEGIEVDIFQLQITYVNFNLDLQYFQSLLFSISAIIGGNFEI